MKKFFLIILIILTVSVLSYTFVNQIRIYSVENTLVKTFTESGAQLVNWEIYFRGKIISDQYNSVEELEYLAEKLSNEIGMANKNFSYNKNLSSNLIHILDIEGYINDCRTTVSINLEKTQDNPVERHISISIVNNGEHLNIEEITKTVQAVLKKYEIEYKVNICITGSFEGKLSNSELAEICDSILSRANARKVEEMETSNMISISAYSPNIGYSIEAAGKKVNINLAVRYNSYENRTYIWLASPVIEIEY
ncbi:MAG TPA: YwmB family TATA-box binding protein [Clostridiaceae bacterium]|nr:YwmB family TATA-box binding protein [Clostridiaceae bacterium]